MRQATCTKADTEHTTPYLPTDPTFRVPMVVDFGALTRERAGTSITHLVLGELEDSERGARAHAQRQLLSATRPDPIALQIELRQRGETLQRFRNRAHAQVSDLVASQVEVGQRQPAKPLCKSGCALGPELDTRQREVREMLAVGQARDQRSDRVRSNSRPGDIADRIQAKVGQSGARCHLRSQDMTAQSPKVVSAEIEVSEGFAHRKHRGDVAQASISDAAVVQIEVGKRLAFAQDICKIRRTIIPDVIRVEIEV
eukprot:1660411-Rhodomonas_salina.3